jgi:hypothetical protein
MASLAAVPGRLAQRDALEERAAPPETADHFFGRDLLHVRRAGRFALLAGTGSERGLHCSKRIAPERRISTTRDGSPRSSRAFAQSIRPHR